MTNSILNLKPQNQAVINNKPQNKGLIDHTAVYLENKTTRVGEAMGLLLALTFPTTVNFVGPRL